MSEKFVFYPPIKQTTTANSFTINILDFQLYKSVRIAVSIFNADDVLLYNRFYVLQGAEYTNWGNDDKYIVDYVKAKLQIENIS